MLLNCPKCDKQIPPEQVHIANDLMYCPECREAFSVTENTAQHAGEDIDLEIIENPPEGAWLKQNENSVSIGVIANWNWLFVLATMTFLIGAVSLSTFFFFNNRVTDEKIAAIVISIILSLLMFWIYSLRRFEIVISRDSYVKHGGRMGWKRKFNWSNVKNVALLNTFNPHQPINQNIVFKFNTSEDVFVVGYFANRERKKFFYNALRYLLQKSK